VLGTRKSAGVQAFGVATKVGAIVVMAVAILLAAGHGARGGAVPEPLPPMSSTELLSGVGLALVATLWAYEGWAYVTYSAGEARDPQRNFAKGIFIGTFGVVLLYLIANIAYVHALGPEAMARSGNHVAAEAVTVTFGPAARVLIVLVAEVAVCSALNSIILTAPRIYYAMARDGLFFKRLADVHPRFGTPATAIIASGVWAMVLATGGYVQLITYVTGAAWVFYGLGAATIFWYRRNRPNVPRPFRVPGYPITPGLVTLAAVAIVLDVAITTPLRAAASLGVIGLGALVYPIWKRQGVAPSLET
jgi:APA family basic amino acid/polyamine antiporter